MAIEILRNSNSLEINGSSSNISITTKTLNSGFSNERKSFNISGKVKKNTPTIIGTFKLTASENKKLTKAPSLRLKNKTSKLNSYLRIQLDTVSKDSSGNINSYLYNLVYTGKEKVSKTNKLRYSLISDAKKIITKTTGITRVTFGETDVSEAGEKRAITVHGTPNSEFKIAVNKITDTKDLNQIGRDFENTITSSIENSIISDTKANSTIAANDGIMNIIHTKLDSNGKYSFVQKIDKATSDTRYSINILPTSASPLLNSRGIWDTNRSGWENWYSKILYQYINPTITLRVTTANLFFSINGQAIPGSGTQVYSRTYRGERFERDKSLGTITYKLVTTTGSGKTLTTDSGGSSPGGDGVPVFSNFVQTSSDWTNSVSADNYGNIIEITNIAVSGSGTSTYTLTLDAKVVQFGAKSVIMTLDLDTVITVSA